MNPFQQIFKIRHTLIREKSKLICARAIVVSWEPEAMAATIRPGVAITLGSEGVLEGGLKIARLSVTD